MEHLIKELIENAGIMYCLFFLLGNLYYSKWIYLNKEKWLIQLALAITSAIIVTTFVIFNYNSDSTILIQTGMFSILVITYLFRNSFISSFVIIMMVFNRLVVMKEEISIVLLSYMVLTIILYGVSYLIKDVKVLWFNMLWITMVMYTIVTSSIGESILLIMATNFSSLVIGITLYYALEYIKESKKMYYAYLKYSSKDYLTKLYNRRKLELDLLILDEAQTNSISVAFIDVDNFKQINDTYGHHMGDIVLKTISDIIIEERLNHMFGYRLSGEEFCLIFKGHHPHDVIRCVKRIQEIIKNFSFQTGSLKFTVSVSIGLVHNEDHHKSIMEIINMADQVMYEAKNAGKNRLIEKMI